MNKLKVSIFLIVFFSSTTLASDEKRYELDGGIVVTIEEAQFTPEQHDIKNCASSKIPCTIDGVFPFGTAFNIPRTYLKRLTFSIKNKTYELDTSGMYNAWGNRPLEHKGSIRYLGAHCYSDVDCKLRGIFSDAAGSYVAEWIMFGGTSQRTVLTSTNDVMHMFMKNIDPPYYD
jgi:hypothetical protein